MKLKRLKKHAVLHVKSKYIHTNASSFYFDTYLEVMSGETAFSNCPLLLSESTVPTNLMNKLA